MTRSSSKTPSARPASRWHPARPAPLKAFCRDEDGAIVAFTLFALLIMLIAGGAAIDVMRHEMERARLQNTLDSAVLAAAGAPFGTTPKPRAIVEDYMAKAGMGAYLADIDDDGENDDDDVIQTLNMSRVAAGATKSMGTYLMQLSGVKRLQAVAASRAERRVPKLEVSLVLDMSGSMAKPSSQTFEGKRRSKLFFLKRAAKEFVTAILNSTRPGDSSISIVPFNFDVAPGPHIFEALSVDARQDYSSCLEFTDTAFDSTAIDPAVEQTQAIYTAVNDSGFDDFEKDKPTCYTDDYGEITPYQMSETVLHGRIDALKGSGNTSGDLGIKWGAALLDPAFQSVASDLMGVVASERTEVNDGVETTIRTMLVDSRLDRVPADWDQANTSKVIVMMGDGKNTFSRQFPTDSPFRGSGSPLYEVTWSNAELDYAYRKFKKSETSSDAAKCADDDWVCVYKKPGDGATYYMHDVRDDEYVDLSAFRRIDAETFEELPEEDGFVSSRQLSWEEAFGRMTPHYLGRWTGSWGAWNAFVNRDNRITGGDKDDRMDNICTAAKDQGITVYTIGFEVGANSHAERELKDCATSVLHYYPVEGVNISDAFSSIASDVINLRLTQ